MDGNTPLDHLCVGKEDVQAHGVVGRAVAKLRTFVRSFGDVYISFSDEVWCMDGSWRRRLCIVTPSALYMVPYPDKEYRQDRALRFHIGNVTELLLPVNVSEDRTVVVNGHKGDGPGTVCSVTFNSSVKAHQFCLAIGNSLPSVKVLHRHSHEAHEQPSQSTAHPEGCVTPPLPVAELAHESSADEPPSPTVHRTFIDNALSPIVFPFQDTATSPMPCATPLPKQHDSRECNGATVRQHTYTPATSRLRHAFIESHIDPLPSTIPPLRFP